MVLLWAVSMAFSVTDLRVNTTGAYINDYTGRLNLTRNISVFYGVMSTLTSCYSNASVGDEVIPEHMSSNDKNCVWRTVLSFFNSLS